MRLVYYQLISSKRMTKRSKARKKVKSGSLGFYKHANFNILHYIWIKKYRNRYIKLSDCDLIVAEPTKIALKGPNVEIQSISKKKHTKPLKLKKRGLK